MVRRNQPNRNGVPWCTPSVSVLSFGSVGIRCLYLFMLIRCARFDCSDDHSDGMTAVLA